MDDLKKFCYDNKDSMDVDLPGAAVWLHIEQKFAAPQKGRLVSGSFIYRAAAASVIIIMAAWLYYYFTPNGKPANTTVFKEAPATSVPGLPPEEDKKQMAIAAIDSSQQQQLFGKSNLPAITYQTSYKSKKNQISKSLNIGEKVFNDMQTSYGQMVSYQLDRVRHTPIYAESADYFILFKTQFGDLDKDEKQLRTDMKQTGVNDDVVMRMINIYQEKIVLLKELQAEIIKMNNHYKSTQDSVNVLPSFIKL